MLEQSILEANGYRVALASSAEEGLARAASERFDLFLVDVEMPGMDGFDFITRTQADTALRTVPAVLVSSRSGAADFARGAAVGARGYVVKHQFDQHEFLSLIERLTRVA
jgi:two-component system chemotaxis sensor kinase CheA